MLACYLLSRVLLRTSSGFNNLLVAAFVLSVINPLVFLGAGFWLSFGAVAVLLWSGRWQGRGGLAKVLRPQLAIALAMLPLGAFWFGGSSWVSPLANLLMIPLLGFFVIPLSLVGACADREAVFAAHRDGPRLRWRRHVQRRQHRRLGHEGALFDQALERLRSGKARRVGDQTKKMQVMTMMMMTTMTMMMMMMMMMTKCECCTTATHR